MNKLVLLSCLVLLTFQVQADHIQETNEETKTEEQPGEEDKAVSVSFGGPGGSAPHGELLRDLVCYCRKAGCTRKERMNGTCRKGNLMYTLCCH